jgi:hypothetical protein
MEEHNLALTIKGEIQVNLKAMYYRINSVCNAIILLK